MNVRLPLLILALMMPFVADAQDIWICGDAPTEREDGTTISPEEISHYTYEIMPPGLPFWYDGVVDIDTYYTEIQVASIPIGNYKFRFKTVDTENRESIPSEELEFNYPVTNSKIFIMRIRESP